MSGSESLDNDTLVMLKDIMDDEFSVLVHTFIEDSTLRIKELQDALSAQDAERVRRASHSLKGSSGNLGASKLTDMCGQLESQSMEGDLMGADVLVINVEAEFQLVKSLLLGHID